jgi:hypothetical protein
MYEGGSGLSVMMHVRFIVLPSLRWMSGPPKIAVLGSKNRRNTSISPFLVGFILSVLK